MRKRSQKPDAPAYDLQRSIEAAKGLRQQITAMAGDDVEAVQDTFDGETTLDVEIRNAVIAIENDEIFIAGCKTRESELKARRSRLEKRVEAMRGLIEQAMTIAEWPRHEMDIGTVTLGKARPRVEIDDESAIPSQFWKRQDPALDKDGLTRVLRERQKQIDDATNITDPAARAVALARIDDETPPIPGARFETGGAVLTIRRS